MTSPLTFFILAILLFVFSNVFIHHLIIGKAEIRVREYLETLGLKLISFKRTGWFDNGNFKKEIFIGGPIRKNGNINMTHYRNIDFKDSAGKIRTSTVKIKWHLFKKTRFEFMPDVKKYAP
ncbi:hypothetical protein [Pontibacter chitinilyticus]|uniref:hypothetical protein n=1 Tax=Pontibacter chitinilyticus TaxID=2674989 RepID=UPI00321BCD0E